MQRKIDVWLSKEDFKQLHDLMDTVIKSEDDKFILERLFEGNSKQEWYRKIIRKGMTEVILELDQLKKKYEK